VPFFQVVLKCKPARPLQWVLVMHVMPGYSIAAVAHLIWSVNLNRLSCLWVNGYVCVAEASTQQRNDGLLKSAMSVIT